MRVYIVYVVYESLFSLSIDYSLVGKLELLKRIHNIFVRQYYHTAMISHTRRAAPSSRNEEDTLTC